MSVLESAAAVFERMLEPFEFNEGMEVHWWPMPQTERGGYLSLCEEYVTGDAVIDGSTGRPNDVKASVTCTECLEWLHA